MRILAFLPAVVVACSSSSPQGGAEDAGASDVGVVETRPDASCMVKVDQWPDMGGAHVPIGTNVTYNSNPPSSGPHYPVWAAFQEFTTPVPRSYYVHDLEHGAIVLLYNCASPCPDIVQGLRDAAAAIPDDPLCAGSGVRARVVITPDPLIDGPVAAAAWDFTYNAACLDAATLTQFARDHYGHGPESVCGNGTTSF